MFEHLGKSNDTLVSIHSYRGRLGNTNEYVKQIRQLDKTDKYGFIGQISIFFKCEKIAFCSCSAEVPIWRKQQRTMEIHVSWKVQNTLIHFMCLHVFPHILMCIHNRLSHTNTHSDSTCTLTHTLYSLYTNEPLLELTDDFPQDPKIDPEEAPHSRRMDPHYKDALNNNALSDVGIIRDNIGSARHQRAVFSQTDCCVQDWEPLTGNDEQWASGHIKKNWQCRWDKHIQGKADLRLPRPCPKWHSIPYVGAGQKWCTTQGRSGVPFETQPYSNPM